MEQQDEDFRVYRARVNDLEEQIDRSRNRANIVNENLEDVMETAEAERVILETTEKNEEETVEVDVKKPDDNLNVTDVDQENVVVNGNHESENDQEINDDDTNGDLNLDEAKESAEKNELNLDLSGTAGQPPAILINSKSIDDDTDETLYPPINKHDLVQVRKLFSLILIHQLA